MELQKLPGYTYVSGITPHPVTHSQGHSFQAPGPAITGNSMRGCFLFNAGYYWEAHEAWEAEWLGCNRSGDDADFYKGLIKLAACGVKCLEKNPAGARRHALRAIELFHRLIERSASEQRSLVFSSLQSFAESLIRDLPVATDEQQQACRCGGVPLLGKLPPCEKPSVE